MQIENIAGNEFLKRAVEVALSGNHSVAIIDTMNSVADSFYECMTRVSFENKLNLKLLVHPICACKGYGTAYYECKCDVHDLKCHLATLKDIVKDYDIIVEALEPCKWELDSFERNEKENAIINRVMACHNSTLEVSELLSNDVLQMLDLAKRDFQNLNTAKVIAVAKTIAKMESHADVMLHHLSEAIQYNTCYSYILGNN